VLHFSVSILFYAVLVPILLLLLSFPLFTYTTLFRSCPICRRDCPVCSAPPSEPSAPTAEALSVAESLQVQLRLRLPRMTIRQGMEFLRVRADLQVDEFVDDDRLEHPARHGLEPMGDADVSRRRRRVSPTADVLVRHPPDRRRTQPSLEVPSAHLLRDLHEIGSGRMVTSRQPVQQLGQ